MRQSSVLVFSLALPLTLSLVSLGTQGGDAANASVSIAHGVEGISEWGNFPAPNNALLLVAKNTERQGFTQPFTFILFAVPAVPGCVACGQAFGTLTTTPDVF